MDGKPFIKAATLANREKPLAVMADPWKAVFNPKSEFMTMGLGFLLSDYRGYKVVEMDGAGPGVAPWLATGEHERHIGMHLTGFKAEVA